MKSILFTSFILIQLSALCSYSEKTTIEGTIDGVSSIYLINMNCAYPYIDSVVVIPVDKQGWFCHSFEINAPSIYRLYFNKNYKNQYEFLKGQAEHARYIHYGLCVEFYTESLDIIIYPGDTIQIRIDNLENYLKKGAKRKSPEVFYDSQNYSRDFFERYRVKFSLTDIDDFKHKGLTANEVRGKLHENNQKMRNYIDSEKTNLNSNTYNYCKQEIVFNELCWFYNISKDLYKNEIALRSNGFYEVESDYIDSIDFNKFGYPIIASRQFQACLDYYICNKLRLDNMNFDLESIRRRIEIAKNQLNGDVKLLYISKLFVNHIELHLYSSNVDELFKDYFMIYKSDPIIDDVEKRYIAWKNKSAHGFRERQK